MKNGGKKLLKRQIQQFSLSPHCKERILRVARTITDLEGARLHQLHHMAGAMTTVKYSVRNILGMECKVFLLNSLLSGNIKFSMQLSLLALLYVPYAL